MKKNIKPLFVNGVIDIHFINPNISRIVEDNMSIYEDMIYEAINYAEKNKINEVYFYNEYINLEDLSDIQYNKEINEILVTLKSIAMSFNIN